MNSRPAPSKKTLHALTRARERGVPVQVETLLMDGKGYIVQLRDGSRLHIIRTSGTEAIWGVERDGNLITVIRGKIRNCESLARSRSNDKSAVNGIRKIPIFAPGKIGKKRYYMDKDERREYHEKETAKYYSKRYNKGEHD